MNTDNYSLQRPKMDVQQTTYKTSTDHKMGQHVFYRIAWGSFGWEKSVKIITKAENTTETGVVFLVLSHTHITIVKNWG